jgi:hypothetical protein
MYNSALTIQMNQSQAYTWELVRQKTACLCGGSRNLHFPETAMGHCGWPQLCPCGLQESAAAGESFHGCRVAFGYGPGGCLASLAPVCFLSLVLQTSGGIFRVSTTICINSSTQINQSQFLNTATKNSDLLPYMKCF